MHNRPLYIYGAGGLGKEVASLVYEINRQEPSWDLCGYFDDAWPDKSESYDLPVVGDMEKLLNWEEKIAIVIAVGDPRTRKDVAKTLGQRNFQYPVLIHPSVILQNQDRINVGRGTILGAGTILTTDIEIGEHVLINLNCTIGHDCRIGDYSAVMPGVNLAGGVELERSVFIGAGANIVNAVHLGEDARVGAGAVVLKDVDAGDTVVGIPAKKVAGKR
jgi:sugar O-acyltransferase (sialic acid O-acetyltransferase NeuD family)